jgi:hypothetical protein
MFTSPRAPITLSPLRYCEANPLNPPASQLDRPADKSNSSSSIVTAPFTTATGPPQAQSRLLDPVDPLDLTYNNPRTTFLTGDNAFISGGSSKGSVITVDNDYDRTNDFIVYNIDSDNTDRVII